MKAARHRVSGDVTVNSLVFKLNRQLTVPWWTDGSQVWSEQYVADFFFSDLCSDSLSLSVIASNFQTCLGLLMHYPPLGDIHSLLQKALFLRDPKVSRKNILASLSVIKWSSSWLCDIRSCSLISHKALVSLCLKSHKFKRRSAAWTVLEWQQDRSDFNSEFSLIHFSSLKYKAFSIDHKVSVDSRTNRLRQFYQNSTAFLH